MRIIGSALIFCALVSGDWLLRVANAPRHEPLKITGSVGFVPALIDLGPHYWETEIPFELRFVNDGVTPVTIAKVERSCDCTLFDQEAIEGASLAPGQSLILPAALAAGERPGDLERLITFVGADSARYDARVRVRVEPTYHLTPDRLDFVLEGDEPSTQTVYFDSESSVLEIHTSASWLSAKMRENIVQVTVDPAKLISPRDYGIITIRTDDGSRSAHINVTVSQYQCLTVIPRHAFLLPGHSQAITLMDSMGNVITPRRIGLSHSDKKNPLRITHDDTGRIKLSAPLNANHGSFEFFVETDICDTVWLTGTIIPFAKQEVACD